MAFTVTIDGKAQDAASGQLLIDVINRSAAKLPRSVITRSSVRSKPATPAWSKSTGNWCGRAEPSLRGNESCLRNPSRLTPRNVKPSTAF